MKRWSGRSWDRNAKLPAPGHASVQARCRTGARFWWMRCAYPPYNRERRRAGIGATAAVRAGCACGAPELANSHPSGPSDGPGARHAHPTAAGPGRGSGGCAALIHPTTASDALLRTQPDARGRVGQISAAHLPPPAPVLAIPLPRSRPSHLHEPRPSHQHGSRRSSNPHGSRQISCPGRSRNLHPQDSSAGPAARNPIPKKHTGRLRGPCGVLP